ncbi:MAG: fumarylacetoacetase [Gemmatimonadaceae bacterium]|nr:fumarylacetoacetase [Gemmatimonadaceae bacterium]
MRDATHDPALRSWVESANAPLHDFPIQNLPFGVFRHDFEERPRVGIRIGDAVLDLRVAVQQGWFDGVNPAVRDALSAWSLNALMALGRTELRRVREIAQAMLRVDGVAAARARDAEGLVVPITRVGMCLPAEIGDYTDFYASVHHATNIGRMLRPDNPLLPNYKWIPIGYHGRASTLVVSETPVRRPHGQMRPDPNAAPQYGPTRSLDYELELGAFIGRGTTIGDRLSLARAEESIFGLCLLNDWSARDVQGWEYQPLGPFLAKNFATSLSPWVVTLDALAPFRVEREPRAADDPAPLPYLEDAGDAAQGGFAITVEAWLESAAMRAAGHAPVRLSQGSFAKMYWTFAQMLTHHASNGCAMQPGDLLGSGTISGPTRDERGCLMELSWRGAEPITLPTGETRSFLADGDTVILRAFCEREGAARIGFGECRGTVVAAE